MEIAIDVFDPGSIRSAIKKLNDFTKVLDEVYGERIFNACVKAAEAARSAYNSGAFEGNDNVSVYVEKKAPLTYQIVATGRDVYFLEFGAGDLTSASGDYESVDLGGLTLADIYAGSYSIEHQQQYVLYGKWWHDGVEYTGITPRRGMNEAVKVFRREIEKLHDKH